MLERRSLLAGLAALPAVGLPLAALASARPDPFAVFHAEVLSLHVAVCSCDDEEASDPHMDRLAEIDEAVAHLRPTTLGEAASALAFARREHLQFALFDDPEGGDVGSRLVLHLIDGALAVLRQATGGGVG